MVAQDKLMALAKGAINYNEKPFSAVTDWIERLCGERYGVDDVDGLIELIESINLQPTGPTEASRAIRKKLKYGNTHRQLRSLTILKALVENCGTRFQSTFANERLVDRIKIMAGDPLTDATVKKKLYSVLLSWQYQFKDDPKMQLVAGLYNQLKGTRPGAAEAYRKEQERLEAESRARQDKKAEEARQREEEKQRLREEKERAKQKAKTPQVKRAPFDFQKEKPNIMAAVGSGSQCAASLVNALQHVNREKESVTENAQVQDYLQRTKLARRQVIRYIQLVEADASGEYIGTLISTNETIIAALHLYDRLCKPPDHDSDDEPEVADPKGKDVAAVERSMGSMELNEIDKLQVKQRMALERHTSYSSLSRSSGKASSSAHSDLADIDFHAPGLQAPMQPRHADHEEYNRGNLSDYSDYNSSEDEASHTRRTAAPAAGYERKGASLLDDDDPFGDANADDEDVGTPGITERPRMNWTSV